ncbi:Disintegrin [Trichuris suis]|nr:Disintegrin [Trichuris suis]
MREAANTTVKKGSLHLMRALLLLILCNVFLPCPARPFKGGKPTEEPFFIDPLNMQFEDRVAHDYDVVYPVRDSDGGFYSSVDSIDSAERLRCYSSHCTFFVGTKWGDFQFAVRRNRLLIPPTARYEIFLHLQLVDEFKQKWRENCYFQGVVLGHPGSLVSLSNCEGLRGFITLDSSTFLIMPMKPVNSSTYPHVFTSVILNYQSMCNEKSMYDSSHNQTDSLYEKLNERLKQVYPANLSRDIPKVSMIETEMKYVELNLFIDKDAANWMRMELGAMFNFFLESLNTLDLFLQHVNVRISLVHAEFWLFKNRAKVEPEMLATLVNLAKFKARKTKDAFNDMTLLLIAPGHNRTETAYFANSVCTAESVGLIVVSDKSHPFYTAMQMTHVVGHILGMDHDNNGVEIKRKKFISLMGDPCRMHDANQMSYAHVYKYTDHSLKGFLGLMNSGQAHCMFNKPMQRNSFCGNRIVDEGEECDCGTVEECVSVDPCCVPLTCRLKIGAQCSKGPYCKGCKYGTSRTVCRPSVDPECDFAEFYLPYPEVKCPADMYKRDGTACGGRGEGYCYHGRCVRSDLQCQELLGPQSALADNACFRMFNIMGTPFGHCGFDQRMAPVACTLKNYQCGLLFCKRNESSMNSSSLSAYTDRENLDIFDCSETVLPIPQLVKDGTKCGSNGLCEAQVCVSLDEVLRRASCFATNESPVCSGHGVCTNLNVCICDDGWASRDCSRRVHDTLMEAVDERNNTLEAILDDQTLYDAEVIDYEIMMVSGISIPHILESNQYGTIKFQALEVYQKRCLMECTQCVKL